MRSLVVAALALVPTLLATVAAAQPNMAPPGMTPPSDAGLVETERHSPSDYEPGIVPEGMNAFIGKRRHVHASLLGASTITLGRDTELATFLLGDVVLFPNLRLERQIAESDRRAASILLGAGAGAIPLAVGGIVPFPGGAIAAGGVGVAWGSFQSATLVLSTRSPENGYAISVNGGAFAVEGGLAVIGGGVVAAGGGGAVVPAAGAASTHRFGGTAGVEFDKTFGRRDALVVAADVWVINPQTMSDASGLLYPRVTWSHRFERWELSGGAYSFIDLPDMKMFKQSKMPVGPYANVAWNWGRN